MKVLVTGGNGFVGRHLIGQLQHLGDDVRVLAMPEEDVSELEESGVSVYRGDVRDVRTLAEPMSGVEKVFHLAAMMGPWLPMSAYRAVNVLGTENVCRAALAAGVRRLVHTSSWVVYGYGLDRPASEDAPIRPFDEPYSVTKAESEAVVRRFVQSDGLPAVIVRPDGMYGPGDRFHFARVADHLMRGTAIVIGSGRNVLPFVYVSDVTWGMILASEAKQAVGQAYNIATDRPVTQEQFIGAMARALGTRLPRFRVPYGPLYVAVSAIERVEGLRRPDRKPPITRVSVLLFGTDNQHLIDRAQADLGYLPKVGLEEGVALAAEWYLNRARRPVGQPDRQMSQARAMSPASDPTGKVA